MRPLLLHDACQWLTRPFFFPPGCCQDGCLPCLSLIPFTILLHRLPADGWTEKPYPLLPVCLREGGKKVSEGFPLYHSSTPATPVASCRVGGFLFSVLPCLLLPSREEAYLFSPSTTDREWPFGQKEGRQCLPQTLSPTASRSIVSKQSGGKPTQAWITVVTI